MLGFKLALRNLIGAGLRTWLNVFVLSLSYVVIIYVNGMLHGWDIQAKTDMKNWEIGQGQYWCSGYDPLDPFTLQESHCVLPQEFTPLINSGEMVPVLVSLASFYPEGRIQSILLKGIPAGQDLIRIPTASLATGEGESIKAVIGRRMAKSNKLQVGDLVTVRWRDRNGTFDAADVEIAEIFSCDAPSVDMGQIWIDLEQMQRMLGVAGEATLLIRGTQDPPALTSAGWEEKDLKFLLAEVDQIIKAKSVSSTIMALILLALALLAVFDTQVLSIFRRQREIGTQIALGMTRWQVVRLFTLEGAMHAVLAAVVAALYGIPLLAMQAHSGIPMPQSTDTMGFAIAEKIFPVYSSGLIIVTVVFILIAATVVSYLPARRISRLNPTEAIKGKIQ
jgi:ABC-type lipoprotein release transport system permease subunit